MTAVRCAAAADLTAPELYALLRLRVAVFVVEQQCPYQELDDLDLQTSTRHLWLPGAAEPAGCLRITTDADGTRRVGRVCTAGWARGTGAGGQLMSAAMDELGDAASVLSAQTYATGFYERFGYRAVGDVYTEDGIEHITMRRAPSP